MAEVASVAAFCLAAAVGRWFFDSKRPAPVPAAIVAAFGEITHLAVDAFSNTASMSQIVGIGYWAFTNEVIAYVVLTVLVAFACGRISVDEHGRTTFTPDSSGDRRHQVDSGMDANAVMNRLRGIYRSPSPRKRAYLFDMDGVLVDNARFHVQGWLELARRHGGRMTEAEAIALMGAPGRVYAERMFGGPLPPDRLAALMAEMSEIYRGLCCPYLKARDGAIEFLKGATAAGIPCALVTGGPMTNVDFVVDGLKIREHFAYIVDVSQYERGKPAPDCYLLAAAKLGVEPRDCVVFEDAINGIRSARAAGMSVVAIMGTHSRGELEDAGPDRIVSSFRELPEGHA